MEVHKTISLKPNPLIERLEAHIAANLDNEQFGVEQLANLMGVSRSQLHRKLQKINGKSISNFIRDYRLQTAKELLLKKGLTASEAAHAVGFSSASYFSTCFTKRYGYSPGKARQNSEVIEKKTLPKKKSKAYKNLVLSLMVGVIALAGLLFYTLGAKGPVAMVKTEDKSIIVLPFKNLSSDTENTYLAEGMVDAISRHLSGINELKVVAPTAVASFPEGSRSIKDIGKKLEVSNVLQGSLQRQGDMLRVEVKLVDTDKEHQLWAVSYDRKFEDILKIQSDIAKNVAAVLAANLSLNEEEIIDKRTSYSPEAYDNYLKGMYYFNLFNVNNHHKSLEYFQKAITIDSNLATAHAGVAAYYLAQGNAAIAKMNASEALRHAEPYIESALHLDPDNAYSHLIKAFILTHHKWDFAGAEVSFKKSLKMNDPLAFNTYRDFLHFEHRHKEASEIADRLNQINPFQPGANMILPYYYNNQWEEGIKYIDEQLELYSNHYPTYTNGGFFMLNTGNHEKAIALFEKAIALIDKKSPRVLGWMGAAYAKKGDGVMARKHLEALKTRKTETDAGSPAFYIAVIHSALGENQEAMRWLKTAVDDREIEVPWLVSEPQLYPLHASSEFTALVNRVGFRPHTYPIKQRPTHLE